MKKEIINLHLCMSSSLVIILFSDNSWLHVAKMTQQKLTDLEYESPYSHDLSTINYDFFFQASGQFFLYQKTFNSKGELETAYKDLLASKPFIVSSYRHKEPC